jgi:hypothetical protein
MDAEYPLVEAAAELSQVGPSDGLFAPILSEAAIMRRLRPDSLAVVLRPDPGTEIFLRLTARDNRIEASARYERGNYDVLAASWSALQRRLGAFGICLLELSKSSRPSTPPATVPFTGFFKMAQSVAEGLSYGLDTATDAEPSSFFHTPAT